MRDTFENLDGVELVYFVRATSVGLIKISSTSSFSVRYAAMRAASPVELTIDGVIVCRNRMLKREQTIQRRFAACRAHHKWFYATDLLTAFVAARTVSPTSVYGAGAPSLGVEATRVLEEGAAALDEELEPLLPIDEIAKRLRVSIQTVRRYVTARDVPYVRVGRQLRFDACEFRSLASNGADNGT